MTSFSQSHKSQSTHFQNNLTMFMIVPLFALQGVVEAVGMFAELQNSGLDFAKQLELEVGEDTDDNLNKMRARPSDYHGSQRSVNSRRRQDSESSQVVSSVLVQQLQQ
jgi:hypothetical protein